LAENGHGIPDAINLAHGTFEALKVLNTLDFSCVGVVKRRGALKILCYLVKGLWSEEIYTS